MEESVKKPKLLLSFLLDNGVSIPGEKLGALMSGFRSFFAATAENTALETELICYDAFEPCVIKSFVSPEVLPVAGGKLPLFARAAELALDRLLAREAEWKKKGEEVRRPWLFLLSDGMTLDEPDAVVARIDAAEREGKLTVLPFRLCAGPCSERMQCLDRTKHMIGIVEGHIPQFFDFVAAKVRETEEQPADTAVRFSKTDFEGWALL